MGIEVANDASKIELDEIRQGTYYSNGGEFFEYFAGAFRDGVLTLSPAAIY